MRGVGRGLCNEGNLLPPCKVLNLPGGGGGPVGGGGVEGGGGVPLPAVVKVR